MKRTLIIMTLATVFGISSASAMVAMSCSCTVGKMTVPVEGKTTKMSCTQNGRVECIMN